MANGGRGLFVEIFKNFWQSLQPRRFEGIKIGSDYFGNTYYEISKNAMRGNSKRQRWFVPKQKDAFDQELPAEWEAWLRGRRVEPPSVEEIEKNLLIMEMKKTNYAKLEAEYNSNKPKLLPEVKKMGYESFPKYDEYETSPGAFMNKQKSSK